MTSMKDLNIHLKRNEFLNMINTLISEITKKFEEYIQHINTMNIKIYYVELAGD